MSQAPKHPARKGFVAHHRRGCEASQPARSLAHRIDHVVLSARRKCRDLFNKGFSPSCFAINVPVVSLPFGRCDVHSRLLTALGVDFLHTCED
jgi:hypothetical protein